jgi:hypothetical protein
VINGPTVHPGANSIRVDGQAYTKNLMYGDRAVLADDLIEGANSIRLDGQACTVIARCWPMT